MITILGLFALCFVPRGMLTTATLRDNQPWQQAHTDFAHPLRPQRRPNTCSIALHRIVELSDFNRRFISVYITESPCAECPLQLNPWSIAHLAAGLRAARRDYELRPA